MTRQMWDRGRIPESGLWPEGLGAGAGSRVPVLSTHQPSFLPGMYDTPTLSVQPGPEVALGDNVTFFCHLATATSTFFLLKEGRSRSTQRGHGSTQAEFPVGPVTAAHQGTYRCFGSYNNHAWSFPSPPVTLLVTGEDTPPSPLFWS